MSRPRPRAPRAADLVLSLGLKPPQPRTIESCNRRPAIMRTTHTRRGLRSAAAMAGVAMLPLLWAPFASGFAGSPAWGVFGGSGRSPAREPITRGTHARVERRLQSRRARRGAAGPPCRPRDARNGRNAARVRCWPVCADRRGGRSSRESSVGGGACACVCAEEPLHVRVPCNRPDCGRTSRGA